MRDFWSSKHHFRSFMYFVLSDSVVRLWMVLILIIRLGKSLHPITISRLESNDYGFWMPLPFDRVRESNDYHVGTTRNSTRSFTVFISKYPCPSHISVNYHVSKQRGLGVTEMLYGIYGLEWMINGIRKWIRHSNGRIGWLTVMIDESNIEMIRHRASLLSD